MVMVYNNAHYLVTLFAIYRRKVCLEGAVHKET